MCEGAIVAACCAGAPGSRGNLAARYCAHESSATRDGGQRCAGRGCCPLGPGPARAGLDLQATGHAAGDRPRLAAGYRRTRRPPLGADRPGGFAGRRRGAAVAGQGLLARTGELSAGASGLSDGLHQGHTAGCSLVALRGLRRCGRGCADGTVARRARRAAPACAGLCAVPGRDGRAGGRGLAPASRAWRGAGGGWCTVHAVGRAAGNQQVCRATAAGQPVGAVQLLGGAVVHLSLIHISTGRPAPAGRGGWPAIRGTALRRRGRLRPPARRPGCSGARPRRWTCGR